MYYRFILPLTLLLLACNGKEKQEKENEDEQYAKIEQQDEKTIVKVQVAQEDRFNLELVSNGKAEANRKAVLNFEVADVVRKVNVKNGDRVKKGDIILRIEASYRCLLLGERLSLNILQRMSGIATETARYVEELAGTHTQLLDTRKTAPGLRVLDKMAVKDGGATNHRMGLYDMAMIKDNHIKVAGGITNAVNAVRAHIPAGIKIEVETTNLAEVREALATHADIIMLDNMSNAEMAEAVKIIHGQAKTEASGNMSIPRLKEVAATGVDFISVGALTHSVTALDISMNIQKN